VNLKERIKKKFKRCPEERSSEHFELQGAESIWFPAGDHCQAPKTPRRFG